MAIEFVVGIAVIALLVGAGIGFLASGGAGKRGRVTELETALASAQTELADYKREVFGQFAETAEKFRALDKSYHDLHRQLATSSVALCGDAATQLLEAPTEEALTVLDAETAEDTQEDVQQDVQQVDADMQTGTDTNLSQDAAEDNVARDDEKDAESQSEVLNENTNTDDNIVVPEAQEVPTLTDLDTEEEKDSKRASA